MMTVRRVCALKGTGILLNISVENGENRFYTRAWLCKARLVSDGIAINLANVATSTLSVLSDIDTDWRKVLALQCYGTIQKTLRNTSLWFFRYRETMIMIRSEFFHGGAVVILDSQDKRSDRIILQYQNLERVQILCVETCFGLPKETRCRVILEKGEQN